MSRGGVDATTNAPWAVDMALMFRKAVPYSVGRFGTDRLRVTAAFDVAASSERCGSSFSAAATSGDSVGLSGALLCAIFGLADASTSPTVGSFVSGDAASTARIIISRLSSATSSESAACDSTSTPFCSALLPSSSPPKPFAILPGETAADDATACRAGHDVDCRSTGGGMHSVPSMDRYRPSSSSMP